MSASSKHTPGPWHFEPADEWRSNSTGEFYQFSRFDISSGDVDPNANDYYRIGSVSNVNNSPRNLANAKLIAAAPELLEALRLLTRRALIDGGVNDPEYQVGKAAIAKATGDAA